MKQFQVTKKQFESINCSIYLCILEAIHCYSEAGHFPQNNKMERTFKFYFKAVLQLIKNIPGAAIYPDMRLLEPCPDESESVFQLQNKHRTIAGAVLKLKMADIDICHPQYLLH